MHTFSKKAAILGKIGTGWNLEYIFGDINSIDWGRRKKHWNLIILSAGTDSGGGGGPLVFENAI